MRVGVLGCGALGGVIAGRLAAVPDVHLEVYNRNPEIAAAVSRRGLRVAGGSRPRLRVARGARRDPQQHLRLELLPGPEAGGGALDLLILATKCNGLLESARAALLRLAEGGAFVTTQNGLVALELAEALGPERVAAGAVLWGASMDEPGSYRLTAEGPFVLGDPRGGPPHRAVVAAEALLAQVFAVRISHNLPGVLWSKLAITACFTTLGAITGLSFGQLVRRRRIRELLLALGAEVLQVAQARGITLESLGGGLNVERFLSPAGYPRPLKHLLMRLVGHKHRHTESSMLDSLRRGRPTEVGFINGRVVQLGQEVGLVCPANRSAVQIVAALEAGRLAPSLAHLERFTVE